MVCSTLNIYSPNLTFLKGLVSCGVNLQAREHLHMARRYDNLLSPYLSIPLNKEVVTFTLFPEIVELYQFLHVSSGNLW